ncbi:MAG: DUF3365 domain-containing protein [Desulfobulbaceae bacterium]|nr:DUF3365 domain-containing protein [Desulfobulbaceae bacterium]
MKSVGTKFFTLIGIVIALFSGFFLYRTYSVAHRHVTGLVGQQADLALKFDIAIRKYVADKVRPVMYQLVGEEEFIPETMSTSFVARAIFDEVSKEFPDFILKFSSENPRNPANKAGAEEIKIIDYFKANPGAKEWQGEFAIGGRQYLAHFKARRMEKSCLRCHGEPADAPASLLARYGSTAAFHLPLGEVVALDTVAIPLDKFSSRLWGELAKDFFLIGLGFTLLFLATFLAFQYLVINRLGRIAQHFTSTANQSDYCSIEPIAVEGNDEISTLARSFNTLAGKLQESYKHLEQEVEERSCINDQLRREMEERKRLEEQLVHAQKMEAVGKLAGGVAHDFNNILTTIMGYSEMISMTLPSGDPMKERVEAIHNAGKKAAALTGQLLAFSRKQVLALKVVDLHSIVLEMGKMFSRLLGEDIELSLHRKSANTRIKADPLQIEQVLMNLAVNARDAMDDGGCLSIETDCVQVEGDAYRDWEGMEAGQYVLLTFSDTGTGMPPEVLERIFEPFYTTKQKGKGSGLGLSTAYGIIKQHGGYIHAYSEVGRGTTFKLYFPCVDQPVEKEEKVLRKALAGGGETILVVEDDPSILKFITDTLAPLGYRLLTAANGKEGLQVSREFAGDIDLLLTDVIMPEMNGMELASAHKELRPATRVLLMSGYAEDIIGKHGILTEGMNFIPKPLVPSVLTEKLRAVMDS